MGVVVEQVVIASMALHPPLMKMVELRLISAHSRCSASVTDRRSYTEWRIQQRQSTHKAAQDH
jgi:hypothetical protein